jgi:hypothetical protein
MSSRSPPELGSCTRRTVLIAAMAAHGAGQLSDGEAQELAERIRRARVEPITLNQRVVGSSPTSPTNKIKYLKHRSAFIRHVIPARGTGRGMGIHPLLSVTVRYHPLRWKIAESRIRPIGLVRLA